MSKGGNKAALHAGKRPKIRIAGRQPAWTAAKRKAFLEELAATCNVTRSLRKVGMHAPGLYKLRARSAEFREEWGRALSEGYAKLELMLLDRAINGSVKTVTRANGSVDKTHEYSDQLALSLLKMHRANASAFDSAPGGEEIEEVRRRVLRKLNAVQSRLEARESGAAAKEGA